MRVRRMRPQPRGWTKALALWLSAILLGGLAALQIQVVLAVMQRPLVRLLEGCEVEDPPGSCGAELAVVAPAELMGTAPPGCVGAGCDAVAAAAPEPEPEPEPESIGSEDASCADPQVIGLLQRLADRCAGAFDSCPEGELTSFAVAAEDFDDVVRRFPGTVTLHFPPGTPPIRGRASDPLWPPPELRAHYLARLEGLEVAPRLRAARSVLLIGRASQGGSAGTNNLYAKARANAAYELLAATLSDEAERAALGAKVKRLILSDRRLLAPEFFAAHYAEGMIGWSRGSEEALRSLLAGRSGWEEAWTRDTINQVAFVVPIACEMPAARSVPP